MSLMWHAPLLVTKCIKHWCFLPPTASEESNKSTPRPSNCNKSSDENDLSTVICTVEKAKTNTADYSTKVGQNPKEDHNACKPQIANQHDCTQNSIRRPTNSPNTKGELQQKMCIGDLVDSFIKSRKGAESSPNETANINEETNTCTPAARGKAIYIYSMLQHLFDLLAPGVGWGWRVVGNVFLSLLSNSFCRLISCVVPWEIVPMWMSQNSSLISQHCFRHQAIAWANIDPNLCRIIALLGHN